MPGVAITVELHSYTLAGRVREGGTWDDACPVDEKASSTNGDGHRWRHASPALAKPNG